MSSPLNPFEVYRGQAGQIVDMMSTLGRDMDIPIVLPSGAQTTLRQILKDPLQRSQLITVLSTADPRTMQAVARFESQLKEEAQTDRLLPIVVEKIRHGRTYFSYLDSNGIPRLLDLEIDNSGSQESYKIAEFILRKNAW